MSKIKVSTSFSSLKLMLLKYKSIFVVYDENVGEYTRKISTSHPSLAVKATESSKTIDTVLEICRWLMAQEAGRDALVLAVGGGVTMDMVGMAAGIYKRGVRYANIPTTLLGMVDAGIGGKTGVNLGGFKNMLGVFRLPEFTYICTRTLQTLNPRELKSGAAELLKTFIIKNEKGNYEKALQVLSGPLDIEALSPLIESAARTKDKIVRKDPQENGARRVLNFGHTYGHAVEWWQHSTHADKPFTHGEAVAIGMVAAARKSEEQGIAKPGLADKLSADFRYCGLSTDLPCPEADLEPAIKEDKKEEGGKLNFVFIKDIGHVTIKKI